MAMKAEVRREIERAHSMINALEADLGSLERLYFAFPDTATSIFERSYSDASIQVVSTIAISHSPASANEGPAAIEKIVDKMHPLPSDYVRLPQVKDTRVRMESVPSKSVKRLLVKRCLVIEKWGNKFVCRVPHYIRENAKNGTSAIIAIPPPGNVWNLTIVKKLQDVCRTMGRPQSTQQLHARIRKGA